MCGIAIAMLVFYLLMQFDFINKTSTFTCQAEKSPFAEITAQ